MDELNSELLAQVEYDVTSQEEAVSFKEYQKIFTTKKKIFQSSLFLIVAIMFLIRVLYQSDYTLGWGLMGVSFALAAYIWINPIITRKNLVKALKNLEGDRYCFSLYNEYFSIKTIQLANTETLIEEENAETQSDVSDIPPKIVNFAEEKIDFVEKENAFIIFLEKQTYYTIPKRCMDIQTQETISSFFKNIKNNTIYK